MRWLRLTVLALALVGCGGGDGGAVEESELARVVLQPQDLPRTYVRFDAGHVIATEGPRGEAGWRARYRIPRATAATRGPLVVESRVDLYSDGDAAEAGLEPYREEFAAAVQSGAVADEPGVSDLGDEALAVTTRASGVPADTRSYAVAWREANVTAVIRANGFEGKLALEDVLRLARKQNARVVRAAAD